MRFPQTFTRYVGTAPAGGKALGGDAVPTGRLTTQLDNVLCSRFSNVNGWPVQRLAATYAFAALAPASGTTVAAGSNGTNQPTAGVVDAVNPQAAGFPYAGSFSVDTGLVTYTGTTTTSFTGCTRAAAAAALTTGDAISFVSATPLNAVGRMFFYEDSTGLWYKVGADVTMVPGAVSFFDVIALLEMPTSGVNLQFAQAGSVQQFLQVDLPSNAPNGAYTFAMGPDLTTQA
jgi:hypothetical protein